MIIIISNHHRHSMWYQCDKIYLCLLNCWYIKMPCPAPAAQCATLCKTEIQFVTDLGLINSIRASRPLCCILECVYFHYFHDLRRGRYTQSCIAYYNYVFVSRTNGNLILVIYICSSNMPILINLVHGPLFLQSIWCSMIWWVTTTLTHWGQVYIDYGKGLLLVRFQAVTWNWYCHINEIGTQWVEDHSIHCMYIYSWNWFLIVLNTTIKDLNLNLNLIWRIYGIL